MGAAGRGRAACGVTAYALGAAHDRLWRQRDRCAGSRHPCHAAEDWQFRAVQRAGGVDRLPGSIPHRLDRSAGGGQPDHVPGGCGGRYRWYAADRWLGHCHRRVDWRGGARGAERWVHAHRHQCIPVQHHTRRGDPGCDAVQHPHHAAGARGRPMSGDAEALRGEDIVKRFGAVTALDGVSLTLRQGEILGVLGDNGAGKSTLIKILTGFHQQTSGKLFVCGEETMLRSVDHARSLGIECVYQDLALANSLSIYHNMFLNREIIRRGPFRLLNNRAMRERAAECLEEIGVHVPSVDLPVEQLSGGQRQAIAVARAVNSNARILLLDEPLAAMGAREAGLIIDLILRLKNKGGLSIIMIMHNYAQTLDIADRVMLMQRGRVTYQREAASTSVEELMDIVRREYRAMRAATN